MFSLKEKQYIASQIERILLDLDHPEMPKTKPMFTLKVEGREEWSFCEIQPNWTFNIDTPPSVNLFNEISRDVVK